MVKRTKTQSIEWQNIFENNLSNKGFVYRLYKEHIYHQAHHFSHRPCVTQQLDPSVSLGVCDPSAKPAASATGPTQLNAWILGESWSVWPSHQACHFSHSPHMSRQMDPLMSLMIQPSCQYHCFTHRTCVTQCLDLLGILGVHAPPAKPTASVQDQGDSVPGHLGKIQSTHPQGQTKWWLWPQTWSEPSSWHRFHLTRMDRTFTCHASYLWLTSELMCDLVCPGTGHNTTLHVHC